MIRRRVGVLAAAAFGVVGIASCGDPLGLRASLAVQFDTLSAFAMTGTPVSYPAALDVANGIVARIGPDVAFDVAFDLGTGTTVKLVPARLVSATRSSGAAVGASPRVGLQVATGSFESVTRAPNRGFAYDSMFTITPGQAVIVELSSDACQFSLSSLLYAKLVVDSVQTTNRRIFFRATRDPNCGYRSFLPGVPKN